MKALEEQLKQLSIRSRMAYCITCLETVIGRSDVNKESFQPLLQNLWNFTSNPDLGDWERRIMPFMPELAADITPDYEPAIGASYQTLPYSLLVCIDEIIEVGRGNLYAGIVDHSPCTLHSTMQVVQFMVTSGCQLPPIQPFQRSLFSEENRHGWGKRVDKSFFE